MDIQEMIEREKRKQQLAEEEKIKAKLRRQIRIFHDEKEAYAKKSTFEISKFRRTLDFLEKEKEIELDNYLATQSTSIETKYKEDEAVVRGLVKTTGVVRDLLKDETEHNKRLEKDINKAKAQTFDCRKKATEEEIERRKFRVPSQEKMDSRVEHANARYHTQRYRNIQLEDKIDSAFITRGIFIKEDAKLKKQLDGLGKMVIQTMNEASFLYEERDRTVGTRQKVTEHLSKVKDDYMNELLALTSTLTEDKEMEAFMRIKQRDNGEYIRQRRAEKKVQVKAMLKQKDEFSVVFDHIKEAIGKNDLKEIVQNFIDKEMDNFSTFLTIGELMDDNERLKGNILDLNSDNVNMELKELTSTSTIGESIETVQERITMFKQKTEECQRRMDANKKTLDDFADHLKTLLGMLNLSNEKTKQFTEGPVTTTNIMTTTSAIEDAISFLVDDFTMVELSTRATQYNKSQFTADETMLMRIPSAHIGPIGPTKFTAISLNKPMVYDDQSMTKHSSLLTYDDVKDYVVKNLVDSKPQELNPKSSRTKSPKED